MGDDAVWPRQAATVTQLASQLGRARHGHGDRLPALPVAPAGRGVFFVSGASECVNIGISHDVSIARTDIKRKNFVVFFLKKK